MDATAEPWSQRKERKTTKQVVIYSATTLQLTVWYHMSARCPRFVSQMHPLNVPSDFKEQDEDGEDAQLEAWWMQLYLQSMSEQELLPTELDMMSALSWVVS